MVAGKEVVASKEAVATETSTKAAGVKETTTESPIDTAVVKEETMVRNPQEMEDESKPFDAWSTAEWIALLGEASFHVMRENGTERPFSSPLHRTGHQGSFLCKGCKSVLFDASSQFDSGCGWPSFDREASKNALTQVIDKSHGMVRVEVRCSTCDSHLGHVFPDGPTETGTRYCINGVCLIPQ